MTDDFEIRRKRALYRAQHRGTKEMDWLLGRYAEVHLPAMSAADLTSFERVIAMPDPDLNAWLFDPNGMGDTEFAPWVAAIRGFHGLT